ncbi:MAG: PaaI family thioesterase [Syntrophomonas sp.]
MDKGYMQNVIDDIENISLYRLLGLRTIKINTGSCEMYMPITVNVLNQFGEVAKGVYYAICDVAAYAASCTILPDEEFPMTYCINVSVLSPAAKGGLKIMANTVEAEYGGCTEVKMFDENKTLVAIGSIRY